MESKYQSELQSFEKAHKSFLSCVLNINPDLSRSSEFVEKVGRVSRLVDSWSIVLNEYDQLIRDKGLEPELAPAAPLPQSILDALLKQLASGQVALTKAVADSGKSRNSPRPQQPFFRPVGSDADYAEFRIFVCKFDFFVKNVEDPAERLEWLQSSCQGMAFDCIKAFSLEPDNYQLA